MAKSGVKRPTKTSKNSSKRMDKMKPMKLAALVVNAIQDLREQKGTTTNKISGYISYGSNLPETRVKRQVKTALKRGVEYGILRRYRGQYFLPSGDDAERANRMAMRFSKFPDTSATGVGSAIGSKSDNELSPQNSRSSLPAVKSRSDISLNDVVHGSDVE